MVVFGPGARDSRGRERLRERSAHVHSALTKRLGGRNGNDFGAVDAVTVDQSLGYIHHQGIESGRAQLDAVAPRVLRVEPPDAGQCLIPDHLLADISQTIGKHVELTGGYAHRWVRLARWCEAILDANVQLLFPPAKPDSTASTKRLWLLDLYQTEKSPVEPPCLNLAAPPPAHDRGQLRSSSKTSSPRSRHHPHEHLTRQKFDH
jgi:hypothetical protein